MILINIAIFEVVSPVLTVEYTIQQQVNKSQCVCVAAIIVDILRINRTITKMLQRFLCIVFLYDVIINYSIGVLCIDYWYHKVWFDN